MTNNEFPLSPELREVERKLRNLKPAPYKGAIPRLGESPTVDRFAESQAAGSRRLPTQAFPWRLVLAASFLLAVVGGAYWVVRLEKPLLPAGGEPLIAEDGAKQTPPTSGDSPQVVQSRTRVLHNNQSTGSEGLDAANQSRDLANPIRPQDETVAGAPTSDKTSDDQQGG